MADLEQRRISSKSVDDLSPKAKNGWKRQSPMPTL
jgi:hypothetical protein